MASASGLSSNSAFHNFQSNRLNQQAANEGVSISDGPDLALVASQLQTNHSKLEGLENLANAISKTSTRALLCEPAQVGGGTYLQQIFRGLRSCLQVPENQFEILLRVNQILYDMMQELQKGQNDLLPEVTNLIPVFIENLGNPKATVRKSTHKCIGTYVKFSRRLEFVLTMIIKHGLENQNQRTRQHSMLVIPALISLKSTIIQGTQPEMKLLIDAVIARLRDPAESVAKTAKKLVLELQKCYPNMFKINYIDCLQNEDDRNICNLILDNKLEEAQKLIISTSPSKRMSINNMERKSSGPGTQSSQSVMQLGAVGKSIGPGSEGGHQSQTYADTKYDMKQVQSQQYNLQQDFAGMQIQVQQTLPQQPAHSNSFHYNDQVARGIQKHSITSPGVQSGKDHQNLSVIGREIINSGGPKKGPSSVSSLNGQSVNSDDKPKDSQSYLSKGGFPVDPKNDLVFGFLEEELVEALNENNQWKDRTNAMETIEQLFEQLINSSQKTQFAESNGTNFLGFIYKLIPDINFKISLASIKIVTLLLQEDLANLKKHFNPLLTNLIEKLSDSKQVVRDMVLECCAQMIRGVKPNVLALQIVKNLQHANWHVRQGVLTLCVRCIIVQSQQDTRKSQNMKPQLQSAAEGSLAMSQTLIEEICFLVKVEDKKILLQMGIDALALIVASSPNRAKTENLVMKELGVQLDQVKSLSKTKDNQVFKQIQQRIQEKALPFLNNEDHVEFQTLEAPVAQNQPSAQFMQHKQNEIDSNSLAIQQQTPQSQTPLELNQINQQYTPSAIKTPSMAFLENKRREEEKFQMREEYNQHHPQSANFKKIQGLQGQNPLSPKTQMPQGLAQNQSQTSYSLSKLNDNRNQTNEDGQEDKKISMWLPSFTPGPQGNESSQASINNQNFNQMSPYPQSKMSKEINPSQMSTQSIISQEQKHSRDSIQLRNNNQHLGYQLNATASSSATFVDDGRSQLTSTTLVSSANKAGQIVPIKHRNQVSQGTRSPLFSETNKESSSDSHSNSNYRAAFGQSQQKLHSGTQDQRPGYIPEAHTSKSRSIQSNQDKQRVFNQSSGSNNSSNQSSAGPTTSAMGGQKSDGFDRSQISDRLQLLKSTNKYKPKYEPTAQGEGQSQYGENTLIVSSQGNATQTMNYNHSNQDQQVVTHPHSMYNGKRQGLAHAAHLKVLEEQKRDVGNKKMSQQLPTSVHLKQQRQNNQQFNSSTKPPTVSQYSNFTDVRGASATQYDEYSRASSIEYTQTVVSPGPVSQSEKKPDGGSRARLDGTQQPQSLQDIRKQDSSHVYDTEEKALINPEQQLRQAVDNLKSSDWQKTFDSCNVIKRAAQFHKNLFTHPSHMTGSIFKDIVKPVESLRSQLAKNACMSLQVMFAELPARDVDPHIDAVMPVLLKRATDTNHFIASEAEKTLVTIVNNCTETRAFTSLQQQSLKSNAIKEKVCLCYTVLIERLAHRLKNFRDLERLVQTIVRFLSEGAIEVRNQAKYAILTLQTASGSQRELDGILLKAKLNDVQMEKVRKVLASEDFESLSNYANTRYGGSMRASPLGGARHTQYGGGTGNMQTGSTSAYGAGSDGFTRAAMNNMQQTFLSSGAQMNQNSAPRGGSSGPMGTSGMSNQNDQSLRIPRGPSSNHGSSAGFGESQNTFKKRTASVSKPVDRGLIEEFRSLVDATNTNDWNKRLKAIDSLQNFAEKNRTTMKSAAPSSFIQLMDSYCKLLQDNNLKVQTRAQQSFEQIMAIPELGSLVNANLTMIVTALTQNLCSTNQQIRYQGDRLFDVLESVVETESRGASNNLLQPIVSQLNSNSNKAAKPMLVDRLTNLVERCDKLALIERLLSPLVQPKHKLANEANGNVQLKQALQRLAETIQAAQVGISGMGIGLKQQY